MSVSNNNSGIHTGSRKPTKKVYDENKGRKKRSVHKNYFDGRKEFVGAMQKDRKGFEGPSGQLFLI